MDIDDKLIEALTEIANHKNVIKELEPHVAFPQKIEAWMTKRILCSADLFVKEYKKGRKKN